MDIINAPEETVLMKDTSVPESEGSEFVPTPVKNTLGYKTIILLLLLLLLTAIGGSGYLLHIQQKTHTKELTDLESQLMSIDEKALKLEAQLTQIEEQEAQEALSVIEKMPAEIPFKADLEDWRYVLVNNQCPIEEDFSVPELTEVDIKQYVDSRIANALNRMLEDGKEAGHDLMICSSYRTFEKQAKLVSNSISKYMRKGMTYQEAYFETQRQIALTGASEHHTGLAVDIVGRNYQILDAAQARTEEAIWLKDHCAEYGFILRYPKNKTAITNKDFESWHFRYVGISAAKYIMENDLCLEEFIELIKAQEAYAKAQEPES